MDAWRSNCLRLTIWEDALADGLVQIENGADDLMVSLTALGRSALDAGSCNGRTAAEVADDQYEL